MDILGFMPSPTMGFGLGFTHPVTTEGYWRAHTKTGTFYIRCVDGLWHATLESESLGAYRTAAEAHNALVAGKTPVKPASGINPSEVGLPKRLSDWPYYPRRPAPGP
jgi:hypothetical protein